MDNCPVWSVSIFLANAYRGKRNKNNDASNATLAD
jgi:hypothetical protein